MMEPQSPLAFLLPATINSKKQGRVVLQNHPVEVLCRGFAVKSAQFHCEAAQMPEAPMKSAAKGQLKVLADVLLETCPESTC